MVENNKWLDISCCRKSFTCYQYGNVYTGLEIQGRRQQQSCYSQHSGLYVLSVRTHKSAINRALLGSVRPIIIE